MVVIALLQMVLDYNRVAVLILGDEVDIECTGRLLTLYAAELKACGVRQNVNVVLQPGGEVKGLMHPHRTQAYPPDSPYRVFGS